MHGYCIKCGVIPPNHAEWCPIGLAEKARTVKFEGFHEDKDLPIKRGDTVTIPKGTVIRTMLPRPEDKVRIAARTYKVRVDHILNGITVTEEAAFLRRGETPGHKSNPTVRWPGKGGYWFEVDINDIPEAHR